MPKVTKTEDRIIKHKFEALSTKSQTNPKFKYQMFKTSPSV